MSGWYPELKTAPKNGTEILIIFPSQGNVFQLVSYSSLYKYWQSKGQPMLGLESQGAHWRYLPAPPRELENNES